LNTLLLRVAAVGILIAAVAAVLVAIGQQQVTL
jgi:hypothetical protein